MRSWISTLCFLVHISSESTVTSSVVNIPPAVWPETTKPSSDVSVSSTDCHHDGVVHQHGSVFQSTSTALRATKRNQCVLCQCQTGNTLCHLKTCPNITCQQTTYMEDDCCPICINKASSRRRGRGGKVGAGCKSQGKLYESGSSWQPIVQPFGKMQCVRCRCKNGHITCRRLRCRRDRKLLCPKKKSGKEPSACCTACRKRHKQPNGRKQARNNSRVACPANKANDILVFRFISSKRVTLAFENIQLKKTDTLSWQIRKGKVVDFGKTTLSTSEVSISRGKQGHLFKVIGSTKNKKVSRFQKRIDRFQKRCKLKCGRRALLKLLAQLKLKKVKYKKKC